MSEALKKIREQFQNNQKQLCPKCAHEITIEETPYFSVEICENCFEHTKVTDHTTCCNKSSYAHVKQITAGGAIQVKEQCSNCGNVKPAALGGFTKEQKEKLPILDSAMRELRYQLYSDEHRKLNGRLNAGKNRAYQQHVQNLKDNWFNRYIKYLHSPEWRDKRDMVLKRDQFVCQCCLANLATQVHHKSYEFEDLSGSIPAFDLVSVCGPCHEWIEEMKRNNRKTQ